MQNMIMVLLPEFLGVELVPGPLQHDGHSSSTN
jgi:hypothetical protein